MGRKIKLFADGPLDTLLQGILQQIKFRIDNEEESYLLNVNEDEYVSHMVSEFTLPVPAIDFDAQTVTPTEKMIPARRHPQANFFMGFEDPNSEWKRQVIVYHLPFTGDISFLQYWPNPRILWTTVVEHTSSPSEGDYLSFEVINFLQDVEQVKRESNQIISNLQIQVQHIKNQINGFDTNLETEIRQHFQARKKDLIAKSDFVSQLGIPIRKNPNTPETFSVPVSLPKKIIPRPAVSTTDGKQDPTIDLKTYNEILQVLHDVGKQIERMPSMYKGKHEEELRDHLLMFLEPKFIGSATGETFNKEGKTDILLRHEGSNVFIAENKFWSGEKKYLETIDQILRYLTWRDSKAAIVLFVKNEDFSSVIDKVKEITPQHPNFLSFDGVKEETWLSYKIHLNGDKGRALFLAVLLFHFPE